MISQMPTAKIGTLTWRGNAGESERGAGSDEVRDADAEVRDQDGARRDHRPADPVLLADQLGEPLAGHHAHAGGQQLHDRQRDRDQDDRPQQVVAVFGADRRVGRDPARVVAGVGGDQPRAEQPEEREHRGAARAKAGRQTRSATGGRPDTAHEGRYSDRHRTVRLLKASATSLLAGRARPENLERRSALGVRSSTS